MGLRFPTKRMHAQRRRPCLLSAGNGRECFPADAHTGVATAGDVLAERGTARFI